MVRIRVAATLAFVCLVSFFTPGSSPRAVSPDVVISQVYGGGGNSGATYTNDFIELYNRGTVAVDVTGWSVQYASSTGSTWQRTILSGAIQPGAYYLVQEAAGSGGTTPLPAPDAVGTIPMSGTAGKVVLVTSATLLAGTCPVAGEIKDFIGFGGANCFEGAGPAPALTNTTAALRGGNGCTDTDQNVADFAAGAPTPRNSGSPLSSCTAPTSPGGIGLANPASVLSGQSSVLTVNVTPGTMPTSTGLTVVADLGAINGSSTQTFFDDGTNGDATAGDLVFSFQATVVGPAGAKTLPVTITDAQARSGVTTIPITITSPATLADIVISQVYGGGGNSGATLRNDFIELHNQGDAAVSVNGWSVQYASSTGSSWQVTPLSGTIPAHGYYLVQEAAGTGGTTNLPTPDASGGIAMAAGSGKVALIAGTAPLAGACPLASSIDFVGYGGANCFEGPTAAPALGNTTAAIRAGAGSVDTDNNGADFSAGVPSPRNAYGIPPSGAGLALPAIVASGGTSLLTVTVTPGDLPPSTGIGVTANLETFGGSPVQPLFDDGSHGDVAAGDGTYSAQIVLTGAPGIYVIPATVSDAQSRSVIVTIRLAIETTFTPIYALQGAGSTSTYAGQLVFTKGIVTARRFNGYYVQVRDGEGDGDPSTSDGIFVFTSSAPPLTAAVGNEVKVMGTVQEFQPAAQPPLTEIGAAIASVMSAGNPLPRPIVLQPSYTTPDGGFEQLERFEGMRITADITAVTGTDGSVNEENATGSSNGDFYAVLRGVARPMREPGYDPSATLPDPAPCCVPAFDGNPEKLRVDSDAQLGAARIEIAAGQTIDGITGVLDYGFFAYTIVPDPGTGAPQGNAAAIPLPHPAPGQFTIASYNLERFFDTENAADIDDPVLTPAALEVRLSKASGAIRDILRAPDILGVIEVENLGVLQTLAARLNSDAVIAGGQDPAYVAYLEEGNDPGGIDVGFLVKSSRVDVVSVEQIGKDTTYHNVQSNREDLLNDRPPLVLRAAVHRQPGASVYPVAVIVNHLRSLNGMTDPGAAGERVRDKRRLQAEFLANFIQGLQAADPNERIVSVGDYNAFQFNDGFVDLIGTIKGTPTPADSVVAPSEDLVDPDLVNAGDALGTHLQYSFTFDGNAQALDHVLLNRAARKPFAGFQYARLGADFPESFRADATRPERLSDHDAAVAYFTMPSAPVEITLPFPIR